METNKTVLSDADISVIIPVYGVESYLTPCVDSVLSQTKQNLCVLLVDDGSIDGSGGMCDGFALSDERVICVHRHNVGLSGARNTGIDASLLTDAGYMMFLDSDDWLDTRTCEDAYAAAKERNADAVFWSYVREFADRTSPRYLFPEHETRVFTGDACSDLRLRMIGPAGRDAANPQCLDSLCTAWGKLLRTSCVSDSCARFTDLKVIGTAEDTLFNIRAFSRVKTAVYLEGLYSHYRRDNAASLTSNYKSRLWSQLNALYDLIAEECGDDAKNLSRLDNRIALNMLGLSLNVKLSRMPFREKKREINRMLNTERYRRAVSALDTGPMPTYWKFFFSACKRRRGFTVLLLCYAIDLIRYR